VGKATTGFIDYIKFKIARAKHNLLHAMPGLTEHLIIKSFEDLNDEMLTFVERTIFPAIS